MINLTVEDMFVLGCFILLILCIILIIAIIVIHTVTKMYIHMKTMVVSAIDANYRADLIDKIVTKIYSICCKQVSISQFTDNRDETTEFKLIIPNTIDNEYLYYDIKEFIAIDPKRETKDLLEVLSRYIEKKTKLYYGLYSIDIKFAKELENRYEFIINLKTN